MSLNCPFSSFSASCLKRERVPSIPTEECLAQFPYLSLIYCLWRIFYDDFRNFFWLSHRLKVLCHPYTCWYSFGNFYLGRRRWDLCHDCARSTWKSPRSLLLAVISSPECRYKPYFLRHWPEFLVLLLARPSIWSRHPSSSKSVTLLHKFLIYFALFLFGPFW